MAKKKEGWRLIIKEKNYYYKLCRFWGWDKDATLNLKIYSNDGASLYRLKSVARTETKGENGKIIVTETFNHIDFENTSFVPNKKTFHPSGVVHSTDNDGNKDQVGRIKNEPFDAIENYRLLAIIIPKEPISYPKINIDAL